MVNHLYLYWAIELFLVATQRAHITASMCSTLSFIHQSHTVGTTVRGNVGFNILPKDTSARMGETGNDPLTLWGVNDPLPPKSRPPFDRHFDASVVSMFTIHVQLEPDRFNNRVFHRYNSIHINVCWYAPIGKLLFYRINNTTKTWIYVYILCLFPNPISIYLLLFVFWPQKLHKLSFSLVYYFICRSSAMKTELSKHCFCVFWLYFIVDFCQFKLVKDLDREIS